MFFLKSSECQKYIITKGYSLNKEENGLIRPVAETKAVIVTFEQTTIDLYGLATVISQWFAGFSWSLLWTTETGIWPSSENLHLYYRLRQSYGDNLSIAAAPGHLFLKHEHSDLISFLELALRFGWGGYMFNDISSDFLIFSHDGWFALESTSDLNEPMKDIERLGLPFKQY